MTIKPFSTYPEAHKDLLHLAHGVENATDPDDFNSYALRLADLVSGILKDEKYAEEIANKDAEALDVLLTPRHVSEWEEDDGIVLWWTDTPLFDPPYVGLPPLNGDWPAHLKWFTPLPITNELRLIQKRIEVAEKAREISQLRPV